jgi:signal transduction histidine kinase
MKPLILCTCRYSALLLDFLRGNSRVISPHLFSGDASTIFSSTCLSTRIQAHEAVVSSYLPANSGKREITKVRKRAARFFAHAIASLDPATATHHTIEALSLHLMELSAEHRQLQMALKGMIADKEEALILGKSNQGHYEQLLKKSEAHHAQLRRLSMKLVTAQEDERRKISRELHDVIAQILAGINIKLASLKKQSTCDTKKLRSSINSTQRLVEKSVAIVHQFACELRPCVIDLIGIIPALQSMAQQFHKRTGITASVLTQSTLAHLEIVQRTCLFRVTEEALTNVERHAEASEVSIRLSEMNGIVSMNIHDNGKSFNVPMAKSHNARHLGLLGMQERVEMLDGRFAIESVPGQGTTVAVSIPCVFPTKRRSKLRSASLS